MDRQALITRFEAELGKVNRPGIDKLMGYIRGSDFYTAPASRSEEHTSELQSQR